MLHIFDKLEKMQFINKRIYSLQNHTFTYKYVKNDNLIQIIMSTIYLKMSIDGNFSKIPLPPKLIEVLKFSFTMLFLIKK